MRARWESEKASIDGLSQLREDLPEIAELDLNPFLAGYRGRDSAVLDMRVRLDATGAADARRSATARTRIENEGRSGSRL